MTGQGVGGLCGAPGGERDRLLAAYVELVAERGVAAVDATTVAERAGAGRRAFGRHFPDRFACFTAAWDRLEGIYLGRLAAAVEGRGEWREQFRAAVAETARLVEAHPAPARFLTVESLAAGERERVRQQALVTRLAGFLDRAREQLDDGDEPPPATPSWIVGMFLDRVYRYLASGGERDLHSQLPELRFLAVSSYFGTEAGLEELRIPPP